MYIYIYVNIYIHQYVYIYMYFSNLINWPPVVLYCRGLRLACRSARQTKFLSK